MSIRVDGSHLIDGDTDGVEALMVTTGGQRRLSASALRSWADGMVKGKSKTVSKCTLTYTHTTLAGASDLGGSRHVR
jgi:hypothetical protein